MLRFIGFCFCLLCVIANRAYCETAEGSDHFGSVAIDSVHSVLDAGALLVDIDAWPPLIGRRLPVQLAAIDLPAKAGACKEERKEARRVIDQIQRWLEEANRIELHNIRRGQSFGVVADVWLDQRSLATELLAAGYGREKGSAGSQSWCKAVKRGGKFKYKR